MDVKDRLRELMAQRGLSVYMLAKKADLTWNTVDNILKKDGNPTVHTLSMLCKGLDITLGEFFNEPDEMKPISAEQQRYLAKRELLTERDKELVDQMIETMLKIR